MFKLLFQRKIWKKAFFFKECAMFVKEQDSSYFKFIRGYNRNVGEFNLSRRCRHNYKQNMI